MWVDIVYNCAIVSYTIRERTMSNVIQLPVVPRTTTVVNTNHNASVHNLVPLIQQSDAAQFAQTVKSVKSELMSTIINSAHALDLDVHDSEVQQQLTAVYTMFVMYVNKYYKKS
jgi:uncharacterized membrane protein